MTKISRKQMLASCLAAALSLCAAAAEHEKHAPKPDPEKVWADLIEGNKRFVAGKAQVREILNKRKELEKGQHPNIIVLACADSRVSPELLFDKNLGDLFVVRTAGNIADKVALGSIEYAAEHLNSGVLLVLGHEKCGAVAAAASGEKMPTENLKAIVDMIAPALAESRKEGLAGDALIAKGVEKNVVQSALDVVKNSPIVKEKVEKKELKIIYAVYRLGTGEVVRLPEAAQKGKE